MKREGWRRCFHAKPLPLRLWLPGEDTPLFMHSLRLEDQLYDFVVIRFLVVLSILFGAFFARDVIGIEQLDVPALFLLAMLLGLCNTLTYYWVRPFRGNHEQAAQRQRFLAGVLNFSIAADFLCLTIALWLVGGAQSPFQVFFVFHVIIASVLLPPRFAFVHASVGYLFLAGLVSGTWLGWIPPCYPEGAVPSAQPVDGRFVLTVLFVQGLLFALTAFLVTHLMRFLREGQREAMHANRELQRLSRQRRDFLQITLHNLRSPIAAIGMHLNNLNAGYGGALSDAQKDWVARSQQRIKELMGFLGDLEYLSVLEAGQLQKDMCPVDLRGLLGELTTQYADLAEARHHALSLEAEEELPPVRGVARLLREAIVNLITNAIKYTAEGGHITIRAKVCGGYLCVEVEDDGIGIAPEDQPRLFKEFVRVHKGRPGMGDVPGSGLGLFIVRQIIDLHRGQVLVQSLPGQGSTFTLKLLLDNARSTRAGG